MSSEREWEMAHYGFEVSQFSPHAITEIIYTGRTLTYYMFRDRVKAEMLSLNLRIDSIEKSNKKLYKGQIQNRSGLYKIKKQLRVLIEKYPEKAI